MIIRDKQDLRKCVKQCVRRAQVIETDAKADVILGEYGVKANLGHWASSVESLQEAFEQSSLGTPFARKQGTLLAALDALQLPVHNLDKAESIISGYDRQAYLTAVLSAMRARKVLLHVSANQAEQFPFEDERIAPLLAVDDALFAPGRYGVNYEEVAEYIRQLLHSLDARDILADGCAIQAIEYCLLPVCEDEGTVLHVHARTADELCRMLELLEHHDSAKAIVSADEALERELIKRAAQYRNVVVKLHGTHNLTDALLTLGTRFIPYSSAASTAEEMLGCWIYAKEALWQSLYEAYLLLARTGYELTREGIEADIEALLCGNYEKLHA